MIRKRLLYSQSHIARWTLAMVHVFACAIFAGYAFLTYDADVHGPYKLMAECYFFICAFKFSMLMAQRNARSRFLSFVDIFLIDSRTFIQNEKITIIWVDAAFFLLFAILTNASVRESSPLFMDNKIVLLAAMCLMLFAMELFLFSFIILVSKLATLSKQRCIFSEYRQHSGLSPDVSMECCICKENINDDDKIDRLKCNHLFHVDCIDQWFSISKCCPLCKADGTEGSSIREILS